MIGGDTVASNQGRHFNPCQGTEISQKVATEEIKKLGS